MSIKHAKCYKYFSCLKRECIVQVTRGVGVRGPEDYYRDLIIDMDKIIKLQEILSSIN